MPDVITLGDLNIDLIVAVPVYPARGGDSVAEGVSLHTGGSALNTALVLACLGVDVAFIGRVGQDALADQALADLVHAGVDTRLVQVDPAVATGMVFVAVTPDGERTMFSARGANSYTHPGLLDENDFAGARWFHFSGYALLAEPQRSATRYALDLAVETGCCISLDVGVEPARCAQKDILHLLSRVDVIFPNETELSLLTGDVDLRMSSTQLLDWGVGAVVAKYGASGSEVTLRNRRATLPAFDVSPLDTTGAGDSFNAGFILGRLMGLDWEAAALLGNAVGALATQWQGAGAQDVTSRVVRDWIEKHRSAPEWLERREVLEEVSTCLESVQVLM